MVTWLKEKQYHQCCSPLVRTQSGLEQVNGYGVYLSDAAYLSRSEAGQDVIFVGA